MRRELPPGWRVIEHAGNEIDARLIAGHLQDAGIRVVLEKDNSGYGDYLYGGGNPNAPVALLVPEEQWEAATSVLDNAAVDVAGSEGRSETEDDETDADVRNEGYDEDLSTTSDGFYLREDPADAPSLAAPARSGLRWVLIALVILVVVIAAVEGGFFSDLVGV